jgi:hypothetical protein
MKKLMMLLFVPLFGWGQSFEKGAQVVDFSPGFLLLYTKIKETGQTAYEKDTTAAFVFPVSYEYGILDWLSGGGFFRFNNFIEGDSNNFQATGIDAGVLVNFHFLRSKRVDWLAGIAGGYSYFKIKANDVSSNEATGGGSNFGIYTKFRFYFNDHFGMHLDLGRWNLNYPSIKFKSGTDPDYRIHLQGAGPNIGLGFQYKF